MLLNVAKQYSIQHSRRTSELFAKGLSAIKLVIWKDVPQKLQKIVDNFEKKFN